jgi:hypothetical protein
MQATRWWMRCNNDNFERIGTLLDFDDLTRVGGCPSCSGWKFKCPQCGKIIKVSKIQVEISNNDDVQAV